MDLNRSLFVDKDADFDMAVNIINNAKRDYEEAKAQIRTEYLDKQKHEKSYVTDGISLEDTMNEN